MNVIVHGIHRTNQTISCAQRMNWAQRMAPEGHAARLGRAPNAKLRGLSLPTGCGSEAASSPRFAVLFSDSGCDGEAGWRGRETLVGGHDSISGDGVAAGTRWEKREQGQVSRMWSLDVEGQSTAQ